MAIFKASGEAQALDGSNLRVAIVHARWNADIVLALVAGARKSLLASGVREHNIIVQDVPGSYELPFAVQKIYASSQIESSLNPVIAVTPTVTDLLSSTSLPDITQSDAPAAPPKGAAPKAARLPEEPLSTPFSAIIAIGVLIKGETMHFEYIAESTSHGLMKIQLDLGVPVIFGLLTVLDEEQGRARAGLVEGKHCHGDDWGRAAVELGVKRQVWSEGRFA